MVVGVQELIFFIIILAANYLLIYLIVSNAISNSGLKSEMDSLKNELKDIKKLLADHSAKTLGDRKNKEEI
ncbi:hypothetical protein [Paenibacillus lautus]|uniref:hypothetical protein n=1 Tax=Paenibacillus lautus TaxID=1401 RepID=UPI000BBD654E|nr:hypothetical protein [Paenibacillus lautus]PCL92802.1 hypothetical protein CPZ30_13570 [Paenibacillus lautus]GIP05592.1 hypothetical protein J28TS4_39990 [Paenibacillus lautus]